MKPSFRIETFERLVSTQDLMRKRLAAGENVDGLVIRAGEQTGGRGRKARDWQAPPGGSYQTLALEVREDGFPPSLIPLALGVGLCQALGTSGVKAAVKWPNDIYYRNKKLAGLLVEVTAGHLLMGVGINVDNEVPEGAVGLRGWDLEGVGMLALDGLQRGLDMLGAQTFTPERFAEFDLLRGKQVNVFGPDGVIEGRGSGIDERGRLLVQRPDRAAAPVSRGSVRLVRE